MSGQNNASPQARLAHALRTLLGETDDSGYMSIAEQQELARQALADYDRHADGKDMAKLSFPTPETWPAWANWIGLDPCSYWIFYEQKPNTTETGRHPTGGQWGEPRQSGWPQKTDWRIYLVDRTPFQE